MIENKQFNIEICAATNQLCSYCQPMCDHKVICDRCFNKKCSANFDGWCRQISLKCWLRACEPCYIQAYKNRQNR